MQSDGEFFLLISSVCFHSHLVYQHEVSKYNEPIDAGEESAQ